MQGLHRSRLLCAALFVIFIASAAGAATPQAAAVGAVKLLLSRGLETIAGADVTALRETMQRFPCATLQDVRAGNVTEHGDTASVDLEITTADFDFPPHWRAELRNDGGQWHLIAIHSPERDLAMALAFADDAKQQEMLRANDALISPELVRRLVDAGTILGSKAMFAREERLASIALDLASIMADRVSRARALWLMGRAQDSTFHDAEAMAAYEESRALAVAAGDRQFVGRSLIGMGWVWGSRYDLDRARADFHEGLDIALPLHDDLIADNAYLGLGFVDNLQGNYLDALLAYDNARKYAELAGDRVVVAAAIANSGITYNDMNDEVIAAERLREAIGIYREIGNQRGEMRNLRNLADVEVGYHDADAAAADLDRLEQLLATQPDERTSAFAAATRSKIAVEHNDLAEADRYAKKALAFAQKVDEQHLIGVELIALSNIRFDQKRYAEAADYAEKAIANAAGRFDYYWIANLAAARAYRKLGRTQDAIRLLHVAVDVIESALGKIPGTEEEQTTYYVDKSPPYYELFDIYASQGRFEEAIQWRERARARTLLDYMVRGNPNADRDITSAEERSQVLAIKQQIVALNRALREQYGQEKKDRKRIQEIEDELRQKRIELQVFMTRLYSEHPDLSLRRGALPQISLSEIRDLIPPDGAIVDYVSGSDSSWAIVLLHSGPPHICRIHANDKELRLRLTAFRKRIASRDLSIRDESRKLFDLLFAPATPWLRGKKSLCILPDGSLWNVPFQALVGRDGKFLIEHKTLFYAPSLSFLAWYHKHPRDHNAASLLAVGNPQLTERTTEIARTVRRDEDLGPIPEAEDEVRTIASLYGKDVTVIVGAAATEERIKREAPHYRIIHLATHATFDDTNPLYSHLVLAAPTHSGEDGLLEGKEIMNLDLNADLVVLSSCETGRGSIRGAAGLVGMSWALLVAGCPTAVVSQWKVGSASTAALMIAFHARLARVPPNERRRVAARALCEAERDMIRKGHTQPYAWSAFLLVGDGW